MKKIINLSLFIFLISTFLKGQDNLVDSLKHITLTSENDSIIVKSYFQIYDHFQYDNMDSSKFYLDKAIEVLNKSDFNGWPLAYDKLSNYFYNISQYDSSSVYQTKSLDAFRVTRDTLNIGKALFNAAVRNYTNSDYSSALIYLEEAKGNFEFINDTLMLAATIVLEASVNKNLGYKKIALGEYYKGIKIHELRGPSLHLADAYLSIGILLNDEEKYIDAKSFFNKSVNMFQALNARNYMAQAMAYKAENLMDLSELKNINSILDSSLEISRDLKYDANHARVLHFQGALLVKKKNHPKAQEKFKASANMYKKMGRPVNEAGVLIELAKLHSAAGFNHQALELLNKLLDVAKEHNHIPLLQETYSLRSKVLNKLGKYQRSIIDLKSYYKIADSLFLQSKELALDELNIIYNTEKKEAEIESQKNEIINLNQEIEISNLRKVIYGIGLLGALLSLILGFFWFKQIAKNEKLKTEAREKELQREIDFKKKELTSQTLHLVQKNTFIQNLAQDLEAKNISEVNFKKETNKILTTLKLEPELDKDWELFKSYFTEVHNDFDDKIKVLCPDISDNEIRLAYLLRMKLNTSEISAVMRVLPESVRKSKYRFKKKLGLDKEQDLLEYLIAV